jgi:hypothetical protein
VGLPSPFRSDYTPTRIRGYLLKTGGKPTFLTSNLHCGAIAAEE